MTASSPPSGELGGGGCSLLLIRDGETIYENLAGVFVASNDLEKSLSVYLRLKALLRKQIPEERRFLGP